MSYVNIDRSSGTWQLRTLPYCNTYRVKLYSFHVDKVTKNMKIMRYCTIVNVLHLYLYSLWPDSRTMDQEADEEEDRANKKVG